MGKILDSVMCATAEDEPRFRSIINDLIESGELPAFEAFINEPKEKRAARKRKVRYAPIRILAWQLAFRFCCIACYLKSPMVVSRRPLTNCLSVADHNWKLCHEKLPKLVCLCIYILKKYRNSLCSRTTRQLAADHRLRTDAITSRWRPKICYSNWYGMIIMHWYGNYMLLSLTQFSHLLLNFHSIFGRFSYPRQVVLLTMLIPKSVPFRQSCTEYLNVNASGRWVLIGGWCGVSVGRKRGEGSNESYAGYERTWRQPPSYDPSKPEVQTGSSRRLSQANGTQVQWIPTFGFCPQGIKKEVEIGSGLCRIDSTSKLFL